MSELYVTVSSTEFAADYRGEYDVKVVYVAGEIVVVAGFYYQAKQSVPVSTAPSGTAESTDHWQFLGTMASVAAEKTRAEAVEEALEGEVDAIEALVATSTWTALEAVSAKLEATAGFQTVRCRMESVGAVVRLRGVLTVKAGEKLVGGEAVATLPLAFRPAVAVEFTTAHGTLKIETSGVIKLSEEVLAAGTIFLDGVTWNLT
jgi:hypothetical protein